MYVLFDPGDSAFAGRVPRTVSQTIARAFGRRAHGPLEGRDASVDRTSLTGLAQRRLGVVRVTPPRATPPGRASHRGASS